MTGSGFTNWVAFIGCPIKRAVDRRGLGNLFSSESIFGRFTQVLCFLSIWFLMACAVPAHAGTRIDPDSYLNRIPNAGPLPIGFTFNYYNQPVTEFYVTGNGSIQFSPPSANASNSCLPGLENTIFAFWHDWHADTWQGEIPDTPDVVMHYETLGKAPNRQLIVQWADLPPHFLSANIPTGTFQVILYEGSNQIKLQYRRLRENFRAGDGVTIGIQGGANQATSIGCNQVNIAAQQAISFTPDATGVNYVSDAAAPYQFTDISGRPLDRPFSYSWEYTNAPEWVWGMVPAFNAYQIEIQKETGESVFTKTLGDVGSFSWTEGFVSGIPYLARIRGSVNGGSSWEPWTGLSHYPLTVDQVPPTAQMLGAVRKGASSVEWKFSAGDAISGIRHAELQIASDASFSNLLYSWRYDGNDFAHEDSIHYEYYTAAVPVESLFGRIVVTDRAGNVSHSAPLEAQMTALPPPQAAFTVNALTGEAPLHVEFQNTSTGVGEDSQYLWDFGNGMTGDVANPRMRYRQPGTYTVTLRALGLGGNSEFSREITVTPDVTAPVFWNTSNGQWAGSPLSIRETTSLNFWVRDPSLVAGVTAEFAGSSTSLSCGNDYSYYSYYYYENDYNYNYNYGYNYSYGTSTGYGYKCSLTIDPWQYASGDHVLSLVATDNAGNTANLSVPVKIDSSAPSAPVLSSTSATKTNNPSVVVYGSGDRADEVQLYVNGIAQSTWIRFSGGGFAVSVPLSEGINIITAVVRNSRGSSAVSNELVVERLPPPQAAFTVNALTGEAPLHVEFQNASTGVGDDTRYSWNFGNGRTGDGPSPKMRYRQPGTYTVTLRASWEGGFSEFSKDITVTPDVTAPVFWNASNGQWTGSPFSIHETTSLGFWVRDASEVAGVTAELAGLSTSLSCRNPYYHYYYHYYDDDYNYHYDFNNNYYYSFYYYYDQCLFTIDPRQYGSGDHVLSLVATDTAGNIANLSVPITISLDTPSAPVLNSTLPTKTNRSSLSVAGSSPQGKEVQFYVNGIAQSAWVPVTNQNFVADVSLTEGVNRITAVVRNSNGSSAVSNELIVERFPPPQAAFTVDALTGEAPFDLVLHNTSTGEVSEYYWTFGHGRSSYEANPSFQYEYPGSYTVTLRVRGIEEFSSVSKNITVTPDVTRPVINPPTIDGVPVGSTVLMQEEKPARISFVVSDAVGVRSVISEFAGSGLSVNRVGQDVWQLIIVPQQYANGDYVLSVVATDFEGNSTNFSMPVKIDLTAPSAPVLTSTLPEKTNQPSVRVRGSSPFGAEAQLSVNGIAQSAWIPVVNQNFEADVSLTEGINRITAVVRNSRGSSATSAALNITLNTAKPNGPSALTASSLAQGKIRLAWTPSQDAASVGHVVLRSSTAFDTPDQATRLNSSPLAGTSFEDLPASDGSYFYRVASVNALGTYSALSNSVQATADNAPPKALSIVYTSLGKVDAATGRYGQGRVNLVLTTNEGLQTVPYLSVVPQGGAPIPIELLKVSDTVYHGNFLIDANSTSGVANVLFSARDMVGNRGTEVLSGATLRIDTEGPVLSSVILNPVAPIKNDAAQLVQATFSYSKAPAQTPQIKYLLSGPLRTSVALSNLTRVSDTVYSASFNLPADAGLGGSEILSFSQQAQDDLDNISVKVSAFNRHQVYQGNLPPVDAPFGFSAKAQAGGKVKLVWQAVTDASSYQIYRQAPGGSLQALTRAAGIEYIDQTPADGRYSYALATVRQANGQESLSAQTAPIEVLASATAPGAPTGLTLTLTGQGIYAAWQAPLSSTVDYYNLYRTSGTTISSIEGLTPLKTRIKTPQTYDTAPSPTQGAYVVTAVDASGNESAISNSTYLNASLLPVRDVRIEQLGSELPVLSWAAPNGNVSGYLVYVGPEASKSKLTPNPVTSTQITDTGFTAGERRYTIASVDANGVEMPRTVFLPNLSSQIASGLPIKRGIMNKLQVQVSNASSVSVSGVRAVVRLPINRDATQFKDHKSAPFTLAPNQTQLVSVIVGGYADLPGAPIAQVGVEVTNEGEQVKISRNQTLDVTEGALVVGMETDEFTRGSTGKLKLTIENTSEVDVELLTATNNGANESSELRFKLLDADNNILATQAYKQVFGANVVTLTNGQTVARIPAGSAYVSDTFNLNVPIASPNNIRVRLEVDKLRYHSGQEDEVQIVGRGSERTVSLSDTAYLGEVTQVSPISSFGDQDIVISGRALDRASKAPLPNTRLKLILNQQGFERDFSVLTDASGEFVYTFKPTLTDAGLYKVSAVHPDMTDRPEQKAFTINRVTVDPTPYKLDVPKNYPFTIPFIARAGVGTAATNLRLLLNATSQPTGQIPAGINIQLPAPLSLAERQTLNVPVQFTANNEAQPSGSLIFDVISDEHANTPIAQVRVNYTLSEAKPYLISTPSLVQTGLAQGGSQVESVTIKNNGLQEAINLQFVLTKADGTAAPTWASIGSAANGTLAIGQSRSIDLAFSPPAGTPEGVYEFKLTVTGENVPSQSLNVYVSVTQSGQGNVLFKTSDIYTATVGKDGKLIAGLAGATITVQNEDVPTVSQELVTDALGEALFQSLPAGRYKFRAKASNHQEASGRLIVKPGITANQSVFLDYNLITVEWSVREITIQDRYEITLNATFETDVPAAVVMMQPTSINLPKMAAGEVYYGELNLTNYGLIRADNVKKNLPKSDAYFRYEFLVDVPATLESKQRVTIPYRVVALQSLEGAANSGTASGGGCYSYSNSYGVTCDFQCANGTQSSSCGASTSWFSVSNSSCPGGGGVGGGAGGAGGGGGGGYGGAFGPGNPSTPIKMANKKCVYVPKGGTTCS